MSTTSRRPEDVKQPYLCPISGMGKPPRSWSECTDDCALYDPRSGECALLGLSRGFALEGIRRDIAGLIYTLVKGDKEA